MKMISPSMLSSLKGDLKAYLSQQKNTKRKTPKIPRKLDSNYFENVSNILNNEGCDSMDISIVIKNGRPHFTVYEETDPWNFDCTLNIGGIQRIKTPQVRDAVEIFLSVFIGNNPFIPLEDSVWGNLYRDVLAEFTNNGEPNTVLEEEQRDFLESNMEEITNCIKEEILVQQYLNTLKSIPKPSREEMIQTLSSIKTEDEKELRLLGLLSEGIGYAYEKRWDYEDFENDSCAYASVIVNEYDFFTVTLSEANPLQLGSEIINAFYDGDCWYTFPKILKILNPDGRMSDEYDRTGFERFCFRLTKTLNTF